MKNFSLKIKILLTILSLTILSLGIFSYLTFNSYKQDKLAFIYDSLASEAQANSKLIKSITESYDFFLSSLIPSVSVGSKKLPEMTRKYLTRKPQVMGLYYHVPSRPGFSQLTLHQSPIGGVSWALLTQASTGISLIDSKSGHFLLKKSLSEVGGFAAVVFRSPELIDTIRSGAGRFNFILKNGGIISRESFELEKASLLFIKKEVHKTKAPFGLFEVMVSGEKYFAAYSKLPLGKMALVNLIQQKKVLLIQNVILKQVLIFLCLMISVSLFIGTLSARWITMRLDDLTIAAKEMEKENFDHEVLVVSQDELGILGRAFNSMSTKIRLLLSELRKYNSELEVMVAERTHELQHLSNIQNAMLNSLGQGFVIIDKDHKILPIYSKAAVDMFETIPEESRPHQILGIDEGETETYREFFDMVFNESIGFDDMVKINPDARTNSKKQRIQLNYAPIKNFETSSLDYILIIGTDKTKEIESIEKFEKEWNFSQMIMKMVSNRFSLNKILAESLKMLEQALVTLDGGKRFPVPDIQRTIHTIKGSFSYFNVKEVSTLANDFEQYLGPFYDTEELSPTLTSSISDMIGTLKNAIEHTIDQYDEIIQYKNSVTFKAIPLKRLEEFGSLLSSTREDLFNLYREQFYFCEVRPYFQIYPGLVSDLALKLNKKIEFSLEGGDLQLPEGNWEELFGSFIHFIRNSADHGIETEDERSAVGKKFSGEIKFAFSIKDGELEIRLSDNGRGIDWKKIALKDSTIHSESDALERILLGGISSRSEVTEVSGRGVGVSAIYSTAQKWKGKVSFINEIQIGLTLIIRVPIKNQKILKNVA